MTLFRNAFFSPFEALLRREWYKLPPALFLALKTYEKRRVSQRSAVQYHEKLLTLKTMKDTKTSNRLQRYYIF